ncbi:MAG: zinc-ribbon domain-containing protein, partial [Candidatus Hodarchaeota archaeon]
MADRTRRSNPSGCPNCANKRKSEKLSTPTDQNRLTLHPYWDYLEGDWNYAKYPRPENYAAGSHKLVEWICQICGKDWETRILYRTRRVNPTSCPKCAQKKGIYADLWKIFELLGEKTTQTFFSNAVAQFRGIESIRPDNVVLLNPDTEITSNTRHFDLIIDPKLTPWGYNVKECIRKYTQRCNMLIIVYLFGKRKSIKHPDIITGKKTPVH